MQACEFIKIFIRSRSCAYWLCIDDVFVLGLDVRWQWWLLSTVEDSHLIVVFDKTFWLKCIYLHATALCINYGNINISLGLCDKFVGRFRTRVVVAVKLTSGCVAKFKKNPPLIPLLVVFRPVRLMSFAVDIIFVTWISGRHELQKNSTQLYISMYMQAKRTLTYLQLNATT